MFIRRGSPAQGYGLMNQKIYAEIISSGSELMLGRLVDTNSAWLSDLLSSAGLTICRHTTVGDELPALVRAFKNGWQEHQVVVVTGGLGPTEDDLTRQAAAEAFGRELVFREDLAEEVKQLFARRGYSFTENNLRQAWLPRGAEVVPNPMGTAPGFALMEEGHLMVFLPGVPQEMKRMVQDWLMPRIEALHPAGALRRTVILKTAGLGESMVDDRVGDLVSADKNPNVGLLAAPDSVRVLVTAEGETEAEVEAVLAETVAKLEERLKGHIYGRGETTLYQAVAQLLKEQNRRLTILDSLTCGRLSGRLAPCLDPDHFGGAQDMPWQKALSGVMEILRIYSPESAAVAGGDDHYPLRRDLGEIRLIATARTFPSSAAEGEISLEVESGIQSEGLFDGRPQIETFTVGGAADYALNRAAARSVFHLWRVLSNHARGGR